jgi:hypothetical protein
MQIKQVFVLAQQLFLLNPPVMRGSYSKLKAQKPGHVPRSVCVWDPSLLAVFIDNTGLPQRHTKPEYIKPGYSAPQHAGGSEFNAVPAATDRSRHHRSRLTWGLV